MLITQVIGLHDGVYLPAVNRFSTLITKNLNYQKPNYQNPITNNPITNNPLPLPHENHHHRLRKYGTCLHPLFSAL